MVSGGVVIFNWVLMSMSPITSDDHSKNLLKDKEEFTADDLTKTELNMIVRLFSAYGLRHSLSR